MLLFNARRGNRAWSETDARPDRDMIGRSLDSSLENAFDSNVVELLIRSCPVSTRCQWVRVQQLVCGDGYVEVGVGNCGVKSPTRLGAFFPASLLNTTRVPIFELPLSEAPDDPTSLSRIFTNPIESRKMIYSTQIVRLDGEPSQSRSCSVHCLLMIEQVWFLLPLSMSRQCRKSKSSSRESAR